ncbi:MAG TPA: DUF1800 domain-containing protein [Thermoanaerobaculia bacterium]|nr:DUF1800 domain-containing protein [Thermoanaerobaculia bacterium]
MSSINWTRDAAAHLLRRAGFGGTPAEIDALYAKGLEGAVSSLVDYEAIDVSAYETALAAKNYNTSTNRGLTQWFLDRMAFSPRPLEEKMTYFWNLHWTSGISKVRGVTLMLNQNKTQRQYALAKFDDLVVKISQDPAMLVWLDNWLSQAAKPNENYARELMELFTLGVDSGYTQSDVTAVSRALTGWTLTPRSYTQADNYNGATFQDIAAIHDNGSKTILGQTGNWSGYDAINIILGWADAKGTKSGRYLGAKLWTYFSSTYPSDFLVEQIGAVYDSKGHSVREVVRAIFLSPEFYEAHTRKTWVRSPVEYAVASVRMLEGTTDFGTAVNSLSGMGQVLFNPEDAKGWDWGTSWMNTGTLFARASLSNTLSTNRGNNGTRFDPNKLLAGKDASTADKVVDILADRLNITDVTPNVRAGWIAYMNANDDGSRGNWTNTAANVDKKVRGVVHLMLTSPAFHLA